MRFDGLGGRDEAAFVSHFALPPTDVEIEVEAYRVPLVINRPEAFYWHGEVSNNTDVPMTRDVWVQVRKPDGSLSGPLALWEDLEIPTQSSITANVRQGVPANAPLGEYNYLVRIGDYPNPQFHSWFALTVQDEPVPKADEISPANADQNLNIRAVTWPSELASRR